jgi:hypothetical protein
MAVYDFTTSAFLYIFGGLMMTRDEPKDVAIL